MGGPNTRGMGRAIGGRGKGRVQWTKHALERGDSRTAFGLSRRARHASAWTQVSPDADLLGYKTLDTPSLRPWGASTWPSQDLARVANMSTSFKAWRKCRPSAWPTRPPPFCVANVSPSRRCGSNYERAALLAMPVEKWPHSGQAIRPLNG